MTTPSSSPADRPSRGRVVDPASPAQRLQEAQHRPIREGGETALDVSVVDTESPTVRVRTLVDGARRGAKDAEQGVARAVVAVEQAGAQAGGLTPTEQVKLDTIKKTAHNAIVDFLKQLDAARAEVELRKKNVQFAESAEGKLSFSAEARQRKENAKQLLQEAEKAYAALIADSADVDTKRKAKRIHQARLRFVELEHKLRGVDVTAEDKSTLESKSKAVDGLTRHDRNRLDFFNARAEYVQLRAEIIGVHVEAFIHEQQALADARALEVAREHAPRLDVFRVWGELKYMTVNRLFRSEKANVDDTTEGVGVETVQDGEKLHVQDAVMGSLLGGAPVIAQEQQARRGLLRAEEVLAALRAEHGEEVTGENIQRLSDDELSQVYREVFIKAMVNGRKPQDSAGYQAMHAEIARRNHARFQDVARDVGERPVDVSTQERVEQSIQWHEHARTAIFKSLREHVKTVDAQLQEAAQVRGGRGHAADTEQVDISGPSTTTQEQQRPRGRGTRLDQVGRALSVLAFMGAMGAQMAPREAYAQEARDSQDAVEQVEDAHDEQGESAATRTPEPVIVEQESLPDEEAPTEKAWHRTDHSTPTGLYEDEAKQAARQVGKKSFTEMVRGADDAINHVLDLGGQALGQPDEPDFNLAPDGYHFETPAERAQRLSTETGRKAQYQEDAKEQAAVWQEPSTITQEQRAESRVDIADGVLHLPNGMMVDFYQRKKDGSKGSTEITVHNAMPQDIAIQAVLGSDYKAVISRLVRENNQESVSVGDAITFVEYHAVRLASLLEVRDYMVSVGLTDSVEFSVLKKEIESEEVKIARFGHVVYDDPFYGQPSESQKADRYIEWRPLGGNVRVIQRDEPGYPENYDRK